MYRPSVVATVQALTLLLVHLWFARACNGGYELIINSIENCAGGAQVIVIDPKSNVTLTEDCNVKSKSTIRTTGFKEAKMKVTVRKNGMPVITETIDLCASMSDAKSNKDAAEIMTMFGVPDHCPVAAGELKTTESQTYSLEQYKQHLLMAHGHIQVDTTIKHDMGESCFKVNMDVTKPGLLG